jgi:2-aminobenzoate-CoA ligase
MRRRIAACQRGGAACSHARTGGQIVKAVVVLRAGNQPTPELVKELQDFVKRTIAPYKYPRAIEFRAQLPRTETGKLQRLRLRDRL